MLKEFNVLFVEDTEEFVIIMKRTLEGLFNEVYTKENGELGLEFFKDNHQKIDLIISDITMPVMDGLSMSEEIKAINPNIPIIITSTHNDNAFLHQSIDIGIDAYLIKPISINELIKTIKKALEPTILKKKLADKEKEVQEKLLMGAKFSAIGQLAAGLTHEINTPLTYIKGSIEIMNRAVGMMGDARIREIWEKQYIRVDDGIDRLVNIVDSMKEVAVKANEDFTKSNIYETVLIACIVAYNRAKHITKIKINNEFFEMNMDKNKYQLEANIQKQRIEQVWIIIINNALDELSKIEEFEDRDFEIFIEDDEQSIKVTFIDNAGGIKESIIDKIFVPFETNKESSGMGIGLSFAKKIVEDNEGEIKAYNNDRGAVFEVTLPK